MNKQRPLILVALMLYIFSPSISSWVIHSDGAWYRPFFLWVLVIVVAFIVQGREKQNDL